jgi:hypothetical protein
MSRQVSLERNFTLKEKIALCHSRISKMRHIEGFVDSGLIAPLPIWSPVPEPYRKTTHDSFSIWGLEAQHPKYLPAILQPFVYVEVRGRSKKSCYVGLREGAYKKNQGVF